MSRFAGRLLLAALSGVLYALAFPPFEQRWLAWIALAPLLAALPGSGTRLAFGLGWVFALVAGIGVAGFLPEMLAEFLDWPLWLGVAVLLAVVGVLGTLYGAWAAWLAWLSRSGRATPLAAAAGFAGCELVRFALPPPAGWAPLALSQALGTRVIQSADLAGVLLPGMLLTATGWSAACLIVPGLRPRRFAAQLLGAGLAVTLALVYGGWRLGQSQGDGPAVEVALVQNGVARRERFAPEQRLPNLESQLALTRQAVEAGAQLVLWPEHAVDFYLREPSPLRDRILAITRTPGPDLVLGGPHHHGAGDQARVYNSVYLIRDGRFAGRSDKLELLPVAETRHFDPGSELRLLEAGPLRVGAFVCSEAIGGDVARRLVRAGAEILVNPSNDSWFSDPAGARVHLLAAALRAVENRRSLLRPTPTGYTAILDNRGRVRALGSPGRSELVSGVVRGSTDATLFHLLGNGLGWLALAIVAGATYRCAKG